MTTSQSRRMYSIFTVVAFLAASCVTASAQVVDIAPGAGNSQAYYSNWSTDGNANATTPAASSYNNYRKGTNAGPQPAGMPTAADAGDGITGIWSNATHGGANSSPCCGNPGMFFGESPSSSSYSDAQLFVRSNIEVGNPNDADSTGRRRFDLRFGFTESPAAWQAGKAANNGDWDLWVGDHGSDTVYMQAFVGATDAVDNGIVADTDNGGNLIDESNQFVIMNQDLMGQSGNATSISNEVDRDRWHKNMSGISTGAMTADDLAQPGLGTFTLAGVGQANAAFDTGVGYNGDVPISWSMELNDAGNADPAIARQVAFKVQFGDVAFTQVFDPGGTDPGATDDVVPNPSFDSGNAFQDGYFDWQNAYPIFFVAPNGGADGATMTMGFTAPTDPSDVDGDGDVDGADFLELQRTNPAGIPAWSAAYGPASAVSAVPEPSTALLMVGMSAGLLASRRRR